MNRRGWLVVALLGALIGGAANRPAAASSGATTVTLTVLSGNLAIALPTAGSAVDLRSLQPGRTTESSSGAGSGAFGANKVSDTRRITGAEWVATVELTPATDRSAGTVTYSLT